MTQDHSALLAQLDALTAADAGAVFAELIRAGLHALIEAEASEKIDAGRYERSAERATHRNGHRTKTASTTSGDVEVKIPKLRGGSSFPSLLDRRRRIVRPAVLSLPAATPTLSAAAMIGDTNSNVAFMLRFLGP
jgi:putative transposase